MNLFRKQLRIQVVRRSESKLRLAEWRNDPALCALAAKVLANPDLQMMLSVLRNEHPYRMALSFGMSTDDRIVLQARTEGYEMCLSTLEALAVNTMPVPLPEAVFEPEPKEV